MDYARRLLAVIAVVMYGPALLLWPIIHPMIGMWRRVGPVWTYVIVGSALACVALTALQYRSSLAGTDFGTNWTLITAGAIINGAVLLWVLIIGRHLNHLNVTQRLGVPELSGDGRRDALMHDGLYARVRHPLYLGVAVLAIGWALIANYAGVYILTAVSFPILALIVALEERELVRRFGDTYREYQREVPRFIPRLGRRARSDETVS